MDKAQTPQSRLLFSILFVAIAALTIGVIVSQEKAFSLPTFAAYLEGLSKPWLIAAAASMLGFIVFEGEAVISVCRTLGYPMGHCRGFVYAVSDIYFSAITPSATGGQPACAYFMSKDKIPASVTVAALLINLTMYTASIIVLGVVALILHPSMLTKFGLLSRVLIAAGVVCQLLLAAFFIALLAKSSLLYRLCDAVLRFLCRIRLLKNEETKRQRLGAYIEEYTECSRMVAGRWKKLVKAFFFNLLQRACFISVSAFIFLAAGGAAGGLAEIWSVQCCTVLGSNSVPIPGAMGVSDYMMLDGFGSFMSEQELVNFELLSRSVSFYVCVIFCGIATLISYCLLRKREKRR